MTHPETNRLLRYAEDDLPEEELLEIDAHLTGCEPCLRRVRSLQYLQSNFDRVWDTWSAHEYGRLLRERELVLALKAAVERERSLLEAARAWLSRPSEAPPIAVHALLDDEKMLACAAPSCLPPSYTFRYQAPAVGVAGPQDGDAQAEEHLGRARELLSQGRAEAARAEIDEASAQNARMVQAAVSEIGCQGATHAEVVVDSRWRRVTVKMWPRKDVTSPSFALLVPKDDPEAVSIGHFEEVAGVSYLVARFENVSSEQFDIVWQAQDE